MTPFGMSGSVQVSVIVVSVGSAVNPVDWEEAVCLEEHNSLLFSLAMITCMVNFFTYVYHFYNTF